MPLNYKKLNRNNVEAYKALRLEALQNQPDAFASSYEDEKDLALEDFAARLEDGFTVGAFDEGALIGIVTFFKQNPDMVNLAHKGMLCAFYVQPKYRSQGIGSALMETVLSLLPEDVTQVYLVLATNNDRAKKFYESFGFKVWGTEPSAVRRGDSFVDDYHMIKILGQ